MGLVPQKGHQFKYLWGIHGVIGYDVNAIVCALRDLINIHGADNTYCLALRDLMNINGSQLDVMNINSYWLNSAWADVWSHSEFRKQYL